MNYFGSGYAGDLRISGFGRLSRVCLLDIISVDSLKAVYSHRTRILARLSWSSVKKLAL